MTPQLDRAYRDARKAMLDCLDAGVVDADGLQIMQNAMANMAPVRPFRRLSCSARYLPRSSS
jgi:hypothetical protein